MALVYDQLMQSAPYDQWVSFTQEIIANSFFDSPSIVDLGCGTGQITIRLAEQGFEMTGVDLAEDMLSVAQQHASEKQLTIPLVQQNLYFLQLGQSYDLAISYCDVINYITDEPKIRQAFSNIYQALNDTGIFIFDIHSMTHVEKNLTNQTFSEIYDDMGYVWFCDNGDQPGEMHHDLTFFVKDKEHYIRFDERHHQCTYPATTYLSWLSGAGFSEIQLCADFVNCSISPEEADQAERIFFVCKK